MFRSRGIVMSGATAIALCLDAPHTARGEDRASRAARAFFGDHKHMMGELFACELHTAIAPDVLGAERPEHPVYTRNEKAGEFIKDKVFAPGRTVAWNDLTRYATRSALGAEWLAAEFR